LSCGDESKSECPEPKYFTHAAHCTSIAPPHLLLLLLPLLLLKLELELELVQ